MDKIILKSEKINVITNYRVFGKYCPIPLVLLIFIVFPAEIREILYAQDIHYECALQCVQSSYQSSANSLTLKWGNIIQTP